MAAKSENIKVVVRCRPFTKKEVERGFKPIVKVESHRNLVALHKSDSDQDPKLFTFNSAYAWDTVQQEIYDDAARPIIEAVLDGYNGTILAYGQTGTGKTYTMEGVVGDEEHKGIILHAFDHIFAHISSTKDREYLVRASFLQIYMEDVYDLLGDPKKKLHVRQLKNDISVVGLSSHIVKTPGEITQLLIRGKENRAVSATAMNAQSSRSHSVFTVVVEQTSERGTRMGKLHLVDLAGSERLSKTEATGQQAIEGAKINQSLLSLGNVISALVTNAKHVSYRDSKLTQLLQDSLGGNAKTVMIATLGPASYNYDETLSTLLYATRARDIKNIPKVNEDPKDALLGQLRSKIAELKKQLEEQNKLAAAQGINVNISDNEYLKEVEDRHQKQMEELMASKTVNEEERAKARAKLEAEYARQKSVRAESDALEMKIKQMEESVLVGGVNLVDKAKQQEEEIRKHKSKMRQKQKEQEELDQQKKESEEKTLLDQQKYGSLKEEMEGKTVKIQKLQPLIKHLQDNIDDIQQQFEREKQEQSQHIRALSKELNLLQLIAENFIPQESIEKIKNYSTYDVENKEWDIVYSDFAGRHQKIEEVVEEKIFIHGVDGPLALLERTNVDEMAQSMFDAEKARKRRANAKRDALLMFSITSDFLKT